jgi:hypothetical protein
MPFGVHIDLITSVANLEGLLLSPRYPPPAPRCTPVARGNGNFHQTDSPPLSCSVLRGPALLRPHPSGGLRHPDASHVVFEHSGGADLRKAHISGDDTHAKSIVSSVEGCKILSMISAGGDSGLPPADVVDASAIEESTVAGRGPAVVQGGAVVRQEVAVDVVIQRFAGAAIANARVGELVASHRRRSGDAFIPMPAWCQERDSCEPRQRHDTAQ